MAKPKLWVISELYYPEQTSTGYFLTRIAEGLADEYDVRIISGRPTYSERDLNVAWSEERHGTRIYRMRSTRFDKDRLVGRALNLVTFTLAATFFAITRLRRGDRVLVVTNPPTLPPLVALAARLRGARAALLVHDVYPEVLIAAGMIRAGGWIDRALGAVVGFTYRQFRAVIVLGRDMHEIIGRRIGKSDTALHIIPNWGDVDEVVPMSLEENPFRRAHGLEGKTVIQFSGNLGRTHDLETVLQAADALADRDDILFLFVGYGGKAALVRDDQSPRRNVRFLDRQPREMLGAMLASADAAIIAFVDNMYGVSVPSRMYNLMAAGTPIIAMAHPRSELALVVSEEAAGWVIDGSSEALAALIARIAGPGGREESRARGAAGRAAACRSYTLPAVLDRFRAVLR